MADTFQIAEHSDQKPKSQRGLWALCAGLAVALVFLQFWGDDDEKPAATATAKHVAQTAAAKSAAQKAPIVSKRKTSWPTISVADLVDHNPFRIREVLDNKINGTAADKVTVKTVQQKLKASRAEAEKLKRSAERVTKLEINKVRFIYRIGGETAALIGEEVVHEGDTYNGLEIVQILPDGVIVQPEQSE